MKETDVALTPQQAEVMERPSDSRTLVVAAAGTGKTEVLTARIRYLIDKAGLHPGAELLILSFSRSAVGAISERVRSASGRSAYTRAVTFDSFATALLASVGPGGDWSSLSYDGRIQAATEAIRHNPEAKDLLTETRHVLVDEIQDLVGVRRDLVAAVIEGTSGGFTLLGDPSQAIYDWQENVSGGDPSELITDWLERHCDFETFRLDKNFRAQTEATRGVLGIGPLVADGSRQLEEAQAAVDRFVRALPRMTSMGQAAFVLRNASRTAAVLCRTNGQALAASSELHELGVGHRLQRRAADRAITPWVGRLFGDYPNATMSRRGFERRMHSLADDIDIPSVDDSWRLLKRMDRQNPDALDVRRLAERIRVSQTPDQLTWTQRSPVVVSTIHRAKGLEFDSVLLLEPAAPSGDSVESLGELRVVYVGLTRARRDLAILAPPDHRFRYHADVDRWVHHGWKRWQRFGIELRGDDVHKGHPGGGYMFDTNDAPNVQRYLIDSVRAGDPLQLRLLRSSRVGLPRAFYGIFHNRRPVGVTSENFGHDLYAVLKANTTREVRWPEAIADLRVESIDTVSGTSAAGSNSGLGPSGIWLRIRVGGMGRFEWKEEEA